jgi:hypothetical protein
MADKDREADESKRREEEEEDEALVGKAGVLDAGAEKAEDKADDDADEPKVASAATKEVSDAKVVESASRVPAKRSPRLAQRRQAPKGSLAKSLMLFVAIVGGLIVLFAIISREEPGATGPAPAPKWSVGQTVDLELTVVPSDSKDLACSSPEDIGGKKCQFETPGKAYAPAQTDDKKVLKPYTTTDRVQIIGAGLWSEPALEPTKLPNTRFSVKCKYKIESKMKSPGIRWAGDGPWYPQQTDWHAGSFSGCTILPP